MRQQPVFLSVDNVLYMHSDSIRNEGGADGVRDLALLEAAVMMPQQQFGGEYLHYGLPAMAGAYLYHIACNHPFVDGNKRAAAMAAFVFLDANGHELTATEKGLEDTVLQVASGAISKGDLILWFEDNSRISQ
jgi:death on curing protein